MTYGEGCDECGDPTPGHLVVGANDDGDWALCDNCFEEANDG